MVPYTFLQNLVNFGTQMGENTLCTLTHQAANFTGGVTTSRFKLESLRNETAIEKKWKKRFLNIEWCAVFSQNLVNFGPHWRLPKTLHYLTFKSGLDFNVQAPNLESSLSIKRWPQNCLFYGDFTTTPGHKGEYLRNETADRWNKKI